MTWMDYLPNWNWLNPINYVEQFIGKVSDAQLNTTINTATASAIQSGNIAYAQQLQNLNASSGNNTLGGFFSGVSTTALIVGGVVVFMLLKK